MDTARHRSKPEGYTLASRCRGSAFPTTSEPPSRSAIGALSACAEWTRSVEAPTPGPLVAAAVVLPQRFRHPLLRDSKLLTAKQRELVGAVIRERAVAWAVAEVSVDDINARGLGWANVEIFRRLVDAVDADGYCCDGNLRIPVSRPLHSLVAGDRKVPAVSAASIIAKVHRDALMTRMHDEAPHYNWASNKGYGAPEHRAAIREYGPTPRTGACSLPR